MAPNDVVALPPDHTDAIFIVTLCRVPSRRVDADIPERIATERNA